MKELKSKILCIEDDEDTCELVTFVFNRAGYEIKSCSQKDCLKNTHEEKFLAIILDHYFDGINGVDIYCSPLRQTDFRVSILTIWEDTFYGKRQNLDF